MSTLKSGDRVEYCGIIATVLYIRKNGVTITYYGRGLRQDECLKRRVSIKDLKKVNK